MPGFPGQNFVEANRGRDRQLLVMLDAIGRHHHAHHGDHWGSIHEAAHAVVARHFRLPVVSLTKDTARVWDPRAKASNDANSIKRLVVCCARDAATTLFLNFTARGHADDDLSLAHLRSLGAGYFRRHWLLKMARAGAERLVRSLKTEIYAVAAALREHRSLSQARHRRGYKPRINWSDLQARLNLS